ETLTLWEAEMHLMLMPAQRWRAAGDVLCPASPTLGALIGKVTGKLRSGVIDRKGQLPNYQVQRRHASVSARGRAALVRALRWPPAAVHFMCPRPLQRQVRRRARRLICRTLHLQLDWFMNSRGPSFDDAAGFFDLIPQLAELGDVAV